MKKQSITEVQLKGVNLVLLLPPYLKKSSSSTTISETTTSLSKKIQNELLQYFPMISVNLENVLLDSRDHDIISKGQIGSQSCAGALVSIDYYNGRLDCWEPFLEQVEIEREAQSRNNGPSEQMIEAKNSINLNITEELIENVSCL